MAVNHEASLVTPRLGIYGYGEVGHGLAVGLGKAGLTGIVAYQRRPHTALTAERAATSGVHLAPSPGELARNSDIIIAVTQGSEAIKAAQAIAPDLDSHHLYVDLASATPRIKEEIAAVLAPSGCMVADGAIEGSPLEHEHRFPIILSGPGAQAFVDAMAPYDMRIAIVGAEIGKSAAIKGLRQILMKGQIALLIECGIAARRYGISDEVLGSVAEWYDALPFMTNASRLVRTTTVHAERRSEEVAMAMSILADLDVEPVMARAALETLQRVAKLDLRTQLGGSPPESFDEAISLMEAYQTPRRKS